MSWITLESSKCVNLSISHCVISKTFHSFIHLFTLFVFHSLSDSSILPFFIQSLIHQVRVALSLLSPPPPAQDRGTFAAPPPPPYRVSTVVRGRFFPFFFLLLLIKNSMRSMLSTRRMSNSFTHSFIHAFIHYLSPSSSSSSWWRTVWGVCWDARRMNSFTHSFIHSLPFSIFFLLLLMKNSMRSMLRARRIIYSFIPIGFIHSFSLIHSFILSFIRTLFHSFNHSLPFSIFFLLLLIKNSMRSMLSASRMTPMMVTVRMIINGMSSDPIICPVNGAAVKQF